MDQGSSQRCIVKGKRWQTQATLRKFYLHVRNFFFSSWELALQQAEWGWEISILGNIQNLVGQGPEEPGFVLVLALVWAGFGLEDLYRSFPIWIVVWCISHNYVRQQPALSFLPLFWVLKGSKATQRSFLGHWGAGACLEKRGFFLALQLPEASDCGSHWPCWAPLGSKGPGFFPRRRNWGWGISGFEQELYWWEEPITKAPLWHGLLEGILAGSAAGGWEGTITHCQQLPSPQGGWGICSTGAAVTSSKDLEMTLWLQGLKDQSHFFSSLEGFVLRVFCSYYWKIQLKYNIWLNLEFSSQKHNNLFAFCMSLS